MNFSEVISSFINGATEGCSGTRSNPGNLKIVEDRLVHYDTTIMERTTNRLIVNLSQYSIQTGRLQKLIKSMINEDECDTVYKVPRDYHGSLTAFIVNK